MKDSLIISDSDRTSVAVPIFLEESKVEVTEPGTELVQLFVERNFNVLKQEREQTGRPASIKINLCFILLTGQICYGPG